MAQMRAWAGHDNYHVRRLSSEGCRPKLPWGQGIGVDPLDCLPILDALHGDGTRFVTRSVANHLNDLTKSDPDAVVARLRQWQEGGAQDPREMAWMTRHALRSLIKQGHSGAMELLGYRTVPDVTLVSVRVVPEALAMGDVARIEVELLAGCDEPVIVDYAIGFVKANGRRVAKVFKLKTGVAKSGVPMVLSKAHHFKADATTFRLYPGVHLVTVMVNGMAVGSVEFMLA